jgi:transposase InsO family protein
MRARRGIRRGVPVSGTRQWVDRFNNRRLHGLLDYVPPEEYEAAVEFPLR